MSFFDPAQKQILNSSPASFQNSAARWGGRLQAGLDQLVPKSLQQLVGTAVVGTLALRAAGEDPDSWSMANLKRVEMYTRNAVQLIPGSHKHLVNGLAEYVLRSVDEAAQEGAWGD
jgi:hypothetical protein